MFAASMFLGMRKGEGCMLPAKSFFLSNFWSLVILKKINTEVGVYMYLINLGIVTL